MSVVPFPQDERIAAALAAPDDPRFDAILDVLRERQHLVDGTPSPPDGLRAIYVRVAADALVKIEQFDAAVRALGGVA